MPTFHAKDVPMIVLYQMARYHSEWSIAEARHFYESRVCGWREPEVITALKRAAYTWADSIPEEIIEEMLEEYHRSRMRQAA